MFTWFIVSSVIDPRNSRRWDRKLDWKITNEKLKQIGEWWQLSWDSFRNFVWIWHDKSETKFKLQYWSLPRFLLTAENKPLEENTFSS